ncbi:MAG TPA: cytochrome c [Thermoanaerobaculia bacterium]|nr:cytochrome c [Thermoanaerobaculia bacterium]
MSRWARAALALLAAAAVSLSAASAAASKKPKKNGSQSTLGRTDFDARLPVLGTRLSEFPPGEGKAIADAACLSCHSTDLVRQQRLNEKQWTASVAKMVGWGAEVPESRKAALIAYLVKNFGPDNTSFEAMVTRPVGK